MLKRAKPQVGKVQFPQKKKLNHLRVCLDTTYFAETENLLLKVL